MVNLSGEENQSVRRLFDKGVVIPPQPRVLHELQDQLAKGVADGKKAVVSGYTDTSGDPEKNAELAKQRAFAVRDALKAAGVAEDRIELKKPEVSATGGDAAAARRVEVALQ